VVAACAYCKGFIGLREPVENPSITHGICEACLVEQLRECECEVADSAPGFSWPGELVREDLALAGSVE
jgi:hypothetical protein